MAKKDKANSGEQKPKGKPGRKSPMTQAEKDNMAAARVVAAESKKSLMGLVSTNKQVLNPKFWSKVDPERANEIAAAIRTATTAALSKKLAAVEAQAQALRLAINPSLALAPTPAPDAAV
jgi:hypothetical protein